ncbi:hypothetical protein [Fundidesulfovibrio putealis]|uniref:hypothetical protein n=1 Tax=Fundidesulfovibrio putealis TaxID=270496 RepID=UPI0005BA27A4|nr:hypothetical protein [Fundidesulfovibrio putealis]
MKGVKLLFLVAAMSIFHIEMAIAEKVVFMGIPDELVNDACDTVKLDGAKKQESMVSIIEINGRYYWQTRDNRELMYRKSGVFHSFVDTLGGGYIRIMDASHPDFNKVRGLEYVEHLVMGLGSITYRGTGLTVAP